MKKTFISTKIISFLIVFIPVFSISAENSKNIFFSPALSGSFRIPIRASADQWEKYPSAGVHIEFSSKMKNLQCNIGIEGGKIHHQNDIVSAYLLHIHFGIQYVFNTGLPWLKFLPQIALTNTMSSDENPFDALVKDNRISFAVVENEYGVRLGIEPRFVLKNFYFGIPLVLERTFSSPDRFDLFIFTVNCGYKIEL